MSEDDWTMTSEPASSLHIGPCERCAALVAERDRYEQVLKRVRDNAHAWHGPEPVDSGHVQALAVIADWCDVALAGEAG